MRVLNVDTHIDSEGSKTIFFIYICSYILKSIMKKKCSCQLQGSDKCPPLITYSTAVRNIVDFSNLVPISQSNKVMNWEGADQMMLESFLIDPIQIIADFNL